MYVVEDGEVELSFEEAGRASKRLGPGEFFGELALLTGDHMRTATAIAMSMIDRAAARIRPLPCLVVMGSEGSGAGRRVGIGSPGVR